MKVRTSNIYSQTIATIHKTENGTLSFLRPNICIISHRPINSKQKAYVALDCTDSDNNFDINSKIALLTCGGEHSVWRELVYHLHDPNHLSVGDNRHTEDALSCVPGCLVNRPETAPE